MKNRLLAMMLTASLAFSITTPVQAGLFSWFLRKKIFNNDVMGNGAKDFADHYQNGLDTTERVLALLSLVGATYFAIDYTMKKGTKENVTLWQAMLGFFSYAFGFKSDHFKEDTSKGETFVKRQFGSTADEFYDNTVNGLKETAKETVRSGNKLYESGVKGFKGFVKSVKSLVNGPEAKTQSNKVISSQPAEKESKSESKNDALNPEIKQSEVKQPEQKEQSKDKPAKGSNQPQKGFFGNLWDKTKKTFSSWTAEDEETQPAPDVKKDESSKKDENKKGAGEE